MKIIETTTLLSFAFAAAVSTPALHAQDQPGDKVNQLIIYGDDECPQSNDDEIVVCARKDEEERYRIPKTLRDDPNKAANQAWSERVKAYEYVGKTGTESCSPVGAGGFTGCFNKLSKAYAAERQARPSKQWGKLIEAERQKRLARIDEEAEAIEARLVEIEKARIAREQARAKEAAEKSADVGELPLIVPPVKDEGGN